MTAAQPSMLLIVPYLGRLPRTLDLWLESCRRNPHVNWLVTNDHPQELAFPPNVQFLQQSADQLLTRMQDKVGVAPKPFHPYKLCDFKATYGVMFEDELAGYDYWGVCDLDMIFGDMAQFLDLHKLAEYTKLFWPGHLTIYRNSPEVNNVFRMPGPGWNSLDILGSSQHYSFSEKGGIHTLWRLHRLPVYHENLVADIKIFAWIDGKTYCYQLIDGQIESREYLYVHFQKRWMPRGSVQIGDPYYITPNGFIQARKFPPSAEETIKLATPTWPARREFWRRRIKEQFARARRLFTREYLIRQPPADVLPPDVT